MKTRFLSKKTSLWGLALLLVIALPYTSVPTFVLRIASLIFIYSCVVSGLNLLVGYCGLLSLAQAGFFGVGAYTTALMNIHWKTSFLLNAVGAVLVTSAVAAVLGLSVLKLKGRYLIMATMGLNLVIQLVASNAVFTGGPNGLPGIANPSILGFEFSNAPSLYFLSLGGLALVTAVIALLVNSPVGRKMIAVREDELAAEAIGINVAGTKLLTFTLAAAIAGLAGTFYAHNSQFIIYHTFASSESFTLLAMLVVGGMGTIPGPVLGTALLMGLPEALRGANLYRFLLYGFALAVVTPLWPGGLASIRLRGKAGRQKRTLEGGKPA